ncbi:DNA/pantothenate metabolism flavo protein [Scenedesmus sp. NREL 46B-D3]|nr:DNA/pantothenate metabolism flavo protein [Scenedesmus sp. NREL 46B-D3]
MAGAQPAATVEEFFADCPCSSSSVVDLITAFFQRHSGADASSSSSSSSSSYSLQEPAAERVAGILRKVQEVQQSHKLLTIPFTTIFEYLQYLQAIGHAAAPFGQQVVFYLAAAVSDFYVPWSQLVPKMLQSLRHEWAPRCMVVSFKLETDESILVQKAAGALDKYHVHAVVANLLHTRKDRVLVIQRPGEGTAAGAAGGSGAAAGSSSSSGVEVLEVLRPLQEPHIEKQLVERIVALHACFQQQKQGQ